MKKITKLVLCLLGVILLSSAVIYKTKERTLARPSLLMELPNGLDSAYISKMISLGMNTTKEAVLFTNIKNRIYWKQNFGLNFLGEDEMSKFLSANDFILGDANKYKNIIPVDAGLKLIENFNLVENNSEEIYSYWTIGGTPFTLKKNEVIPNMKEGQMIEFVSYRDYPNGIITQAAIERTRLSPDIFCSIRREIAVPKKILIIGAEKDFALPIDWSILNNILTPPPPKDPIAVIKVSGGYVELANWE